MLQIPRAAVGRAGERVVRALQRLLLGVLRSCQKKTSKWRLESGGVPHARGGSGEGRGRGEEGLQVQENFEERREAENALAPQ